jgi:prolipoprotein diacylglyceryltransferase
MFPYLSIGPLSLPTPELCLILGFWLGTYLTDHESKKSNLDQKLMDNLIWILLISGLLGARLSYIARNITAFQGNLKGIISLNPALFDPAGGFLIALTAGLIFLSRKQIHYWKILDGLTLLISSILISLSLGKFASGKNYGLPTNMPWGINLWGEYRHPVQLYILVSGIITLIIAFVIYRRTSHLPGFTFLLFSAITSGTYLFFSRFMVTDSYLPGGYRTYQIFYWILLAICLSAMIYLSMNSWLRENGNGS